MDLAFQEIMAPVNRLCY